MAINLAPLVERYGTKGVEAAKTAVGGDLSQLVFQPQASSPDVKINTPTTVDSTVINGTNTKQDVLDERANMESKQNSLTTNQQQFTNFLSSLQSGGTTNSDQLLSQLIFPSASPTQQLQGQLLEQQRGVLGGFIDKVGSMIGRDSAARRQQLQEDAGIANYTKQVEDSNVRLAKLQGELQSIRPQIETEAGQTRLGAEARLAPVERNLRAEIASEAILQSALQGNLQAAQKNVDTLLQLELGDEARDLQLYQTQLQLAQQQIATLDPQLQQEAEQRANMLQIALSDRQFQLQQRAQDRQTAITMASQALANGAPGELAKQAMLAATPEQAAAILGNYLVDQNALLDRELKRAELADIQARKDAIAGGSYVLSEDQQTAAFKLIDDYEARISDITDVDAAYTRILASGTEPSAAGDLSLIFNYMKMLDPGSVVRESEFATAAGARAWLTNAEEAGTSVPGIVRTAILRANTGQRLLPEQRQDFLNRSKKLYEGAINDKAKIDEVFSDRAQKFGVPADAILRDFAARPTNTQIVTDATAQRVLLGLFNTSSF